MREISSGVNALPVASRRRREPEQEYVESDRTPASPQIWSILWRRRWVVITCIVVALIGGFIYQIRTPPVYASSSVVYVQDSAKNMVDDPSGTESRSTTYLFTQCQIITSSEVLSLALEQPGVAEAKCLRGVDNAVGYLKSTVSAVPDKLSDLIVVTMESPNPQDAAVIVNAVVEAYIDYQGRQHKSTAVEVLTILQKEVDQHTASMRTDQDAMLKLRRENPDLAFQTDKGNIVLTRLSELSGVLSQAQLRAIDLKTAVAESKALENDPVRLRRLVDQFQLSGQQQGDVDADVMSAYRQERAKLDDLLYTYGPRKDSVIQTQQQVGKLQSEIVDQSHRLAESYAALLQQAQDSNAAQVRELQAAVDALRGTAVELTTKQIEYDQYQQDYERSTRALDMLDGRIKDLNLNEDVGSLTISPLETAKPGFAPVRPLPSKSLGMGLVAGLLLGGGLAFLLDTIDTRLRSADEISSVLDLPILGSVPHMAARGGISERGKLVQSKPRSAVSEAYRTIRTAIYFGASDMASAKCILLTSPAPGDGKSTCVSNLAIAAAQAGRRVLLIDADCRRPNQHKIFGLAEGPGLSGVLMGELTLAQAVQTCGIERLSILPCGSLPHNPAELLDSQALVDLLQQASSNFDQILIDSPPIVPVTDARILAATCDITVLVIKADSAKRRLVEHTRDALASVGANLIGVIVNDVPSGRNGYGYDYYGLGRYGYAPAKEKVRVNGNGHARAVDDLASVSVGE